MYNPKKEKRYLMKGGRKLKSLEFFEEAVKMELQGDKEAAGRLLETAINAEKMENKEKIKADSQDKEILVTQVEAEVNTCSDNSAGN